MTAVASSASSSSASRTTLVGGGLSDRRSSMGVVSKFVLASLFMWALPMAIIYGFNHNLFPGINELSPGSMTLWSGILAVISVNVVIVFYIYAAMKEPSNKHEPDPKFVADAKASVNKFGSVEEDDDSTGYHTKQE